MPDALLDRMKADRGWLAGIMQKVPGFRGYLENTTIWEADRMVREELAGRLAACKEPVSAAVKAAGKDVRAGDRLSALESLMTRLDRVANKVRFADYGHSALSAKVKIREADLARLLAADRALFEKLPAIESAAAASASAPESAASCAAALGAFELKFDARKQTLVQAAAGG
jgi:hypothetical protein